ncbi:MAG TPA: hypothetical protein VN625_10670 [Desulfuromonadaceae bacterium]|nr:hypothetical protein [Desulfuromonadaceae bacterium]
MIIIVAAFIPIFGVRYVLLNRNGAAYQTQLHNLKLAEDQGRTLREKFKDDPRFKRVIFGSFTSGRAGFVVGGNVDSEEDVRYITNAVQAIACPVETRYSLVVSNGQTIFEWMDQHPEPPQWIRN